MVDPVRAPPQQRRRRAHPRNCWAAAKSYRCRPATRQQALDALRRQVWACPHCRPDTELGVLD
ncbi:DUF6233 domain-containing protein [Streptomyces sp. NPDC004008]